MQRRFIWTLSCITIVALVSAVSMAVYRAKPAGDVGKPVARTASGLAGAAATDSHTAGDNTAERAATGDSETTVDKPTAAKPAGDFHSARFGYSLNLAGTPWTHWESLSEVAPEAEWGALLKNYGRLLVVPVALADLDPRPEALDSALLARLGIAYPSEALTDFREIELGGAKGHSFHLQREVHGVENDYRLWILRRKQSAYLAAVWFDEAAWAAAQPAMAKRETTATVKSPEAEIDAQLDAVLARFAFDATATLGPRLDELSVTERRTHAVVFNDLGMCAFNGRDFAGAIDCFSHAFMLEPNDVAMLHNLVNAHVELKQYREALALLTANLQRFPNEPDLWAGRAFVLGELGQTDEALAAYAALFATGYRAEGPLEEYIALLAENDRAEEALAIVERLLKEKDSLSQRRLQAELLVRLGRLDRAIAVLDDLMQNRPFNPEVAYDLANVLLTADRADDSLAICRQLLEHRYDTAHTFWLQARSDFDMKRYADARQSLEAALKREPAFKDARELLSVVNDLMAEGK
ncbi:MAG TPA: tetratricopeptide repeat protein [Pirellulales bacterium]